MSEETVKYRRNKSGGRQPGHVNKQTKITKEIINNMLSQYQDSGKMYDDFYQLEPKDRIQMAEKLMQYIMPKLAATQVDLNATVTEITIEQKLIELSKE